MKILKNKKYLIRGEQRKVIGMKNSEGRRYLRVKRERRRIERKIIKGRGIFKLLENNSYIKAQLK